MKKAILLVSGSRAYPFGGILQADALVEPVLADFARLHAGSELVLMHGDCPHPRRGAAGCFSIDQIADRLGSKLGFVVERRPADWSLGRKAGPLRNQQMVDECRREYDGGSSVKAAGFPYGEAHGTRDLLRRAKKAGLVVEEVIRA